MSVAASDDVVYSSRCSTWLFGQPLQQATLVPNFNTATVLCQPSRAYSCTFVTSPRSALCWDLCLAGAPTHALTAMCIYQCWVRRQPCAHVTAQ